MRLKSQYLAPILATAHELGGPDAQVWLFGSQLDDAARGGDVDLLLDLPAPVAEPAMLAARFATRVSRLMHWRKVDVLVHAPNIQRLPIHDLAFARGVRL